MDAAMYRAMRELEAHNWWFVGMRQAAAAMLRGLRFGRALDVGCGSGGNLELLHELARSVVACDLADAALRSIERPVHGRARCDGRALPFAAASFDLVCLFNVVEHIDDDAGAVAEAYRVLARDGRLLVVTSAFQALWSDHDVAHHHHRRYRRGDLVNLVRAAGFEVERCSFGNGTLFLPTLAVATARRAAMRAGLLAPYERNVLEVRPWLNRVLQGLLSAEAAVLERTDLPVGVSLLMVARKR